MFKKSLLVSGAAILATATALPAYAQSADDDEIIVTATKRSSTLQETPVAVSVTSADVIQKAQILDIKDLQSVVPAFRVSQLQNSANTTLTIRGFGNGGNNYGIEPAVGLFIDGVYRSRAAAQISDLPALERVEILSGPQSTLFGKNASAGVVSIVTQKPQFETEGYVEAGLGNYAQNYAKGYITGGVGENTAVSLGVGYQKRDGYFTNLGGAESDLNNLNRYNLRGQILWEPTDNLSVRLIGDLNDLNENCCGTGVAIEGPLNGVSGATAGQFVASLGGSQPTAANQFAYETYTNSETENKIKDSGLSAQVDWDLGLASLTSITALRKTDSSYVSDSDYNSLDVLGDVFQTNILDTFTQELRLASNGGNRLEWMVGGYYFNETIEQDSGILYGADTRRYLDALAGGAAVLGAIEAFNGITPGTFFADGTSINEVFVQDDEAYSLFGTVDYEMTDRLTFTVGANYTNDKKDVSGSSVNGDVFGNLDLSSPTSSAATNAVAQGSIAASFDDPTAAASIAFASAFGGIPLTAANFTNIDTLVGVPGAQAGFISGVQASVTSGLEGLQFQPQFLGFPNEVEDGKTADDQLTYTAKAAYEVNDNINVYGSYATGFKASSWNLTRDSRPFLADGSALSNTGLLPTNYIVSTGRNFGTRFTEPETVKVMELGLKARFEKGAINLALFDQTVKNFQSTIFQGTGFVLANAGQQSTQGIEFDSTFTPVEFLTLTFGGVIQDPVYDSFTGAPVVVGSDIDVADGSADGVGDISGAQPAGINEVALTASATFTHEFESGMSMFVRGNYQYEDEVQIVDNIQGLTRDTSLFNGSIGFDWENGIGLRFWGNNLTNHETYTSAFPGVIQANTVNAYPNQPRTYGVALRYDF